MKTCPLVHNVHQQLEITWNCNTINIDWIIHVHMHPYSTSAAAVFAGLQTVRVIHPKRVPFIGAAFGFYFYSTVRSINSSRKR